MKMPLIEKFGFVLVFAAVVMLKVSGAKAGEHQSLASIALQAEAFVMQYPFESPYAPVYKAGRLDSRLKLKACPDDLLISFARSNHIQGNTALSVSCPGLTAWKIHLPVRIDLYDDVAVATKPLLRGQFIDESVIGFKKTNVTRLNYGYFLDQNALNQVEARRNMKRGTVLSPKNLAPRMLVKSGQNVTLVLNYNGLQIKSSGMALQSARLGQVIRVRNSQSQKVVEGIVSGEALVKISL